jgi:hypothetical protein
MAQVYDLRMTGIEVRESGNVVGAVWPKQAGIIDGVVSGKRAEAGVSIYADAALISGSVPVIVRTYEIRSLTKRRCRDELKETLGCR